MATPSDLLLEKRDKYRKKFADKKIQQAIEQWTTDIISANQSVDQKHNAQLRTYIEYSFKEGYMHGKLEDVHKTGREVAYDLSYKGGDVKTQNLLKFATFVFHKGREYRKIGAVALEG